MKRFAILATAVLLALFVSCGEKGPSESVSGGGFPSGGDFPSGGGSSSEGGSASTYTGVWKGKHGESSFVLWLGENDYTFIRYNVIYNTISDPVMKEGQIEKSGKTQLDTYLSGGLSDSMRYEYYLQFSSNQPKLTVTEITSSAVGDGAISSETGREEKEISLKKFEEKQNEVKPKDNFEKTLYFYKDYNFETTKPEGGNSGESSSGAGSSGSGSGSSGSSGSGSGSSGSGSSGDDYNIENEGSGSGGGGSSSSAIKNYSYRYIYFQDKEKWTFGRVTWTDTYSAGQLIDAGKKTWKPSKSGTYEFSGEKITITPSEPLLDSEKEILRSFGLYGYDGVSLTEHTFTGGKGADSMSVIVKAKDAGYDAKYTYNWNLREDILGGADPNEIITGIPSSSDSTVSIGALYNNLFVKLGSGDFFYITSSNELYTVRATNSSTKLKLTGTSVKGVSMSSSLKLEYTSSGDYDEIGLDNYNYKFGDKMPYLQETDRDKNIWLPFKYVEEDFSYTVDTSAVTNAQ